MNLLRMVLLGLAAVVLVALGWRLVSLPPKAPPSPPAAPVLASPPPKPEPRPAPAAPGPSAATPGQGPETTVPTPAPAPSGPAQAGLAQAGLALTAQAARVRIDAVLPAAPDLAHAFDVLKAQFPAVAERSMTEATEAYRQSGALPSPDDLFGEAMHDLRQSAGVLAAKAGPDALGAIFDDKATLLADLEQADPRICADYLFGGTSPEFSDFESGHRGLVARSALVNISAMADGRTRQRNWGPPTADDFKWIEGELAKKGLSAEEIAALLDGRASDPAPPDARLCDNARTYLDVLKTMPAEARNRVYGLTAELLARS